MIETNAADPTANVNVIESDENKVFYEFLGFIGERRAIAAPMNEPWAIQPTEAQIQEARQVLTDLGEEVGAEQQRIWMSTRTSFSLNI